MTTVQNVIDQVSRKLRDVNKKTYKLDILVAAINYAIQSTINVHPDASTVYRNIKLAAGTEQKIDDDLYKLVRVLHNVDPTNGQARRSITKANMTTMDNTFMHWRQDAPRGYIEHYMLDGMDDKIFHVWPPADITRQDVEIPTTDIVLDASSPQEDIDAYNAHLEDLELYARLPAKSMEVRAVAAKIPCVGSMEEPVEPVAPVDPGPTNVPENVTRIDAFFSNGLYPIVFEFPEGDNRPFSSVNGVIPFGDPVIITFKNSASVWSSVGGNLGGISDVIYPHGAISGLPDPSTFSPSGSSMGIASAAPGAPVYYLKNDPLWDNVDAIFGTNLAVGDKFSITDEEYVPVVQEDIDQYQADLATYETSLAQYTLDLATYNELVNLTDDMPLNKTYHPAIIEMMLYYCFAADDELTANNSRANAHFQNFFNLMGTKVQNSLRIMQVREEDNL